MFLKVLDSKIFQAERKMIAELMNALNMIIARPSLGKCLALLLKVMQRMAFNQVQ